MYCISMTKANTYLDFILDENNKFVIKDPIDMIKVKKFNSIREAVIYINTSLVEYQTTSNTFKVLSFEDLVQYNYTQYNYTQCNYNVCYICTGLGLVSPNKEAIFDKAIVEFLKLGYKPEAINRMLDFDENKVVDRIIASDFYCESQDYDFINEIKEELKPTKKYCCVINKNMVLCLDKQCHAISSVRPVLYSNNADYLIKTASEYLFNLVFNKGEIISHTFNIVVQDYYTSTIIKEVTFNTKVN